MRTYESLLALIQELEGDATDIDRVMARNRTAWERIEHGADDPVDWGALAFTIHTAYGVLENYFLRISKYFENNLPPERWHQALVDKMAIDIPGVRPTFFSDASQKGLVKEIVRFRHRVRNLYGEDLNPEKTMHVQRTVETFFAEFPRIHREFVSKLHGIADAL
ncbi:MAG TPA: hypothetical protein VJ932_12335 [Alkalispirochaeta sp.]|nr:hypothetical protein [Alkalispirochaeta sp.]